MGPHGVARGNALSGAQRAPQRGGVAQATGTQLEADQRSEGLLCWAASGAAATDGFLESSRVGHPRLGGEPNDLIDPAFDQGQGGFELGQGMSLGWGLLGGEEIALHRLLNGGWVSRVEIAHGVVNAGDVEGGGADQ